MQCFRLACHSYFLVAIPLMDHVNCMHVASNEQPKFPYDGRPACCTTFHAKRTHAAKCMATAQHIHMGDPINWCVFVAYPTGDGAVHVIFQALHPVANFVHACF